MHRAMVALPLALLSSACSFIFPSVQAERAVETSEVRAPHEALLVHTKPVPVVTHDEWGTHVVKPSSVAVRCMNAEMVRPVEKIIERQAVRPLGLVAAGFDTLLGVGMVTAGVAMMFSGDEPLGVAGAAAAGIGIAPLALGLTGLSTPLFRAPDSTSEGPYVTPKLVVGTTPAPCTFEKVLYYQMKGVQLVWPDGATEDATHGAVIPADKLAAYKKATGASSVALTLVGAGEGPARPAEAPALVHEPATFTIDFSSNKGVALAFERLTAQAPSPAPAADPSPRPAATPAPDEATAIKQCLVSRASEHCATAPEQCQQMQDPNAPARRRIERECREQACQATADPLACMARNAGR